MSDTKVETLAQWDDIEAKDDKIKRLRERVAELEAELVHFKMEEIPAYTANWKAKVEYLEAERDAALAQVAVLREALERSVRACPDVMCDAIEPCKRCEWAIAALAAAPAPDILRRVAERAADAALRACDELVRSDPDYVAMDPLPVFSSLDRTAIIKEATR